MISRTAEYALRAAVHLAARSDRSPASARDISEAVRVPVGYLQKILRTLCRRGLLHANRGAGGGFRLARAPETISVLDVLVATDSQIERIERCPLGLPCHKELCPLHRLLDGQMERVEQSLRSTTLRDLTREGSVEGALCRPE